MLKRKRITSSESGEIRLACLDRCGKGARGRPTLAEPCDRAEDSSGRGGLGDAPSTVHWKKHHRRQKQRTHLPG